MNETIRDQWTESLKSGDYKQGHSALHYKKSGVENFCCLGVLCDLYQKEHPETSSWRATNRNDILFFDAEGAHGEMNLDCNAYPPIPVLEWSGLLRESVTALSVLNDAGLTDFTRMAEEIEEKH